ncbi:MAG: DUF6473 family protein [Paracoccaceae bacterium]
MTYESLREGGLDYLPCRYGASRLAFRGPRRTIEGRYIAFLGGTETYGKFVERPFPSLVEEATGLTCVNLGLVNAGADVYLQDETVQDIAAGAALTVIQVTGAQNISNRYYAVHPRRNDRFLKAAGPLRALYPEVDFTEFHFNRHMLRTLEDVSRRRFERVAEELKSAWLARMSALLNCLSGPKLLLWFAPHCPPGPEDRDRADPLFVEAWMLEHLRPAVAAIVEVVVSTEARVAGTQGMVFASFDAPAAALLPGPHAHREAAGILAPLIARFA